MTEDQKKFQVYLTVLRFLAHKITTNYKRLYLDVNESLKKVFITAYLNDKPSELELELLDDIESNSDAHLPNHAVYTDITIIKDEPKYKKHDFLLFAFYEEYEEN